jgi:DNA-binding transcriptional ArsR family regulator
MTDVFASDVAAFSPRTDPTFEAHGFRRPPVRRSHKSEPPDTHKPINFAFRLRALFGTGTRAEVVRILLTSEQRSLNVAHVAQEAAFAKRNVNETLLALLRAGVVEARWSGNERFFTLDRKRWTQLFGTGGIGDHLPQAAPWIWLLRALTAVYRWLGQIDPEWSPYMVASRAREIMDSIAGDAERAGIHVKGEPQASGETYWPRFEALVQDLLKLTRTSGESAGKERSSA